jgi:hypothetical protein
VATNLKVDGDRLWDSLMEMAKIGATAKGGADVKSQLGDALTGSDDNTALIASSAGAGAAGILLIGGGLMWWRGRRRAY